MERSTLVIALFTLVASLPAMASGAAPEAVAEAGAGRSCEALVHQLTVEIRNLRLELLELRLTEVDTETARRERLLRQIAVDRRGLQEQERAVRLQVADLDDYLRNSSLTAEERDGMEATRAELVSSELARLQAEGEALAGREAAVHERLLRSEQRRREVEEGITRLGAR